jgi:hypothetical protein
MRYLLAAITALVAKCLFAEALLFFAGPEAMIALLFFLLVVPVIIQIVVKREGWASLGFKRKGNPRAVIIGLLVGIVFSASLYFIASRIFPGAVSLYKLQILSENISLDTATFIFILIMSFCMVIFHMGYVGGLVRNAVPAIGGAAPLNAALISVSNYYFLAQNPSLDGLIAFLITVFGSLWVMSYLYYSTRNILSAWAYEFAASATIIWLLLG